MEQEKHRWRGKNGVVCLGNSKYPRVGQDQKNGERQGGECGSVYSSGLQASLIPYPLKEFWKITYFHQILHNI